MAALRDLLGKFKYFDVFLYPICIFTDRNAEDKTEWKKESEH